MQAFFTDTTILRLQKIVNKPISRGLDKILNEALDELERIKKK